MTQNFSVIVLIFVMPKRSFQSRYLHRHCRSCLKYVNTKSWNIFNVKLQGSITDVERSTLVLRPVYFHFVSLSTSIVQKTFRMVLEWSLHRCFGQYIKNNTKVCSTVLATVVAINVCRPGRDRVSRFEFWYYWTQGTA